MPNEPTRVFFAMTDPGTVEAFFPDAPWSMSSPLTVYAHVGQHSGACWDYAREDCRPATYQQWKALADELHGQGYQSLSIISYEEALTGHFGEDWNDV